MSEAKPAGELRSLLVELSNAPDSEERIEDLSKRISDLSPDPAWSDHIYYSEEFVREDGSVDIDGLIKKILNPSVINL